MQCVNCVCHDKSFPAMPNMPGFHYPMHAHYAQNNGGLRPQKRTPTIRGYYLKCGRLWRHACFYWSSLLMFVECVCVCVSWPPVVGGYLSYAISAARLIHPPHCLFAISPLDSSHQPLPGEMLADEIPLVRHRWDSNFASRRGPMAPSGILPGASFCDT